MTRTITDISYSVEKKLNSSEEKDINSKIFSALENKYYEEVSSTTLKDRAIFCKHVDNILLGLEENDMTKDISEKIKDAVLGTLRTFSYGDIFITGKHGLIYDIESNSTDITNLGNLSELSIYDKKLKTDTEAFLYFKYLESDKIKDKIGKIEESEINQKNAKIILTLLLEERGYKVINGEYKSSSSVVKKKQINTPPLKIETLGENTEKDNNNIENKLGVVKEIFPKVKIDEGELSVVIKKKETNTGYKTTDSKTSDNTNEIKKENTAKVKEQKIPKIENKNHDSTNEINFDATVEYLKSTPSDPIGVEEKKSITEIKKIPKVDIQIYFDTVIEALKNTEDSGIQFLGDSNIDMGLLKDPRYFRIGGKPAKGFLFTLYKQLRGKGLIEDIDLKTSARLALNKSKKILKVFFEYKGYTVIDEKKEAPKIIKIPKKTTTSIQLEDTNIKIEKKQIRKYQEINLNKVREELKNTPDSGIIFISNDEERTVNITNLKQPQDFSIQPENLNLKKLGARSYIFKIYKALKEKGLIKDLKIEVSGGIIIWTGKAILKVLFEYQGYTVINKEEKKVLKKNKVSITKKEGEKEEVKNPTKNRVEAKEIKEFDIRNSGIEFLGENVVNINNIEDPKKYLIGGVPAIEYLFSVYKGLKKGNLVNNLELENMNQIDTKISKKIIKAFFEVAQYKVIETDIEEIIHDFKNSAKEII